jgi:hypothetical protein
MMPEEEGEDQTSFSDTVSDQPAENLNTEPRETLTLDQRVEELEDLVLVESVGIEELKNMIKDVQEKLANNSEKLPSDIQDKLAALEEVDEKISDLNDMKQSVEKIASEVYWLKGKLSSGSVTMSPGSSKEFENLMDKHFIDLKDRVEATRKNFFSIESRIGNIEGAMQKLKSTVEGIEKVENMAEMVRNLQGKMEEYKMIINDFKTLSERVDNMHANINQKIMVADTTGKLDQLKNDVWQGISEIKSMMQSRASKEDFNLLRQKIESLEERNFSGGGALVSTSSDGNSRNIEDEMERLKEDVREMALQTQEPVSVLNIQMSDMLGKFIAIEIRLANAERLIERFLKIQPVVIE